MILNKLIMLSFKVIIIFEKAKFYTLIIMELKESEYGQVLKVAGPLIVAENM